MHELTPGTDPRREDLKHLTTTQLSTLQDNQSYRDSERNMKDAIQNVSRMRQRLFQDDSEWVPAHEDLVNANHDKLDGEKSRGNDAIRIDVVEQQGNTSGSDGFDFVHGEPILYEETKMKVNESELFG